MAEPEKDNGNGKSKPTEPQPLIMTITLFPDGKLSVQAPAEGNIYNEMLCDYLMKKASRFIEAHNYKASQPLIQIIKQPIGQRLKGLINQGG